MMRLTPEASYCCGFRPGNNRADNQLILTSNFHRYPGRDTECKGVWQKLLSLPEGAAGGGAK